MSDRGSDDTPDEGFGVLVVDRAGEGSRLGSRRVWGWLVLIAVAFLVLRVPLMYRQPGGEDEECYAIPGLTILENGIPRLPHVPARHPESVYFRADEALFAEPPLSFYVQAAFYSFLPHVYGTARLVTGVAALCALGLVFLLGRTWGGSDAAGLWAAGIFSLSRWFYLPAMHARPDMMCAAFGLCAVWCLSQWHAQGKRHWIVLTGVSVGLGGLTHPFAIVYAAQVGLWSLWGERGWRRALVPAVITATAIIVAALWVPLIMAYPETFRVQFENQFLTHHGTPLGGRLLQPWDSIRYHFDYLFHHIGAVQMILALGGLTVCSLMSLTPHGAQLRPVCLVAWTAIYLLSACVGTHHRTPGYWAYPAALMFICVGRCVEDLRQAMVSVGQSGRLKQFSRLKTVAVIVLLLALLAPGSGIRTWIAAIRHWNDINYNAPRFAQRLLAEIPEDQRCTVDWQFALDFVAAGRPTLLLQTMPVYFSAHEHPYDVLIISRFGMASHAVQLFDCRRERTLGIEADIFACYAEIYVPQEGETHDPPEDSASP